VGFSSAVTTRTSFLKGEHLVRHCSAGRAVSLHALSLVNFGHLSFVLDLSNHAAHIAQVCFELDGYKRD
jgi:hypothetical protein